MIKAGIMLEVTSWENDGDFYQTKQLSGLTDSEAIMLIEFLNLFSREGKFGNNGVDEVSRDEFIKSVEIIIAHHYDTFISFFEHDLDSSINDDEYFIELIHEVLCDKILGYSEEYNDVPYFFRKCESIKVYNVPGDIFEMNLEKYVDMNKDRV
jgi:hypothetical protein